MVELCTISQFRPGLILGYFQIIPFDAGFEKPDENLDYVNNECKNLSGGSGKTCFQEIVKLRRINFWKIPVVIDMRRLNEVKRK